VEDVVEERRREVNRLSGVTKAPIVLEYFEGDLQNSQDVIMGLKNTINNKNDSIKSLENKIVGMNTVIASLTAANFSMMSAKITSMDERVRHFEELYKQEVKDKNNVERSLKDLEERKIRIEKDHNTTLDSYTRALAEVKKTKIASKRMSIEKVEEFRKKSNKYKAQKEEAEASQKEIMKQNSVLRSQISSLVKDVARLEKEKEETLRTYVEIVDQKYENDPKNNQNYEELVKENKELAKEKEELTKEKEKLTKEKKELTKEIDEQRTMITELQLEASEFKEQNEKLIKKLNMTWSSPRDLTESKPKSSLMSCQEVSVGILKIGQRRLFFKDLNSESSRYIPAIFDVR
jgi:chromosome segregation ATPase